MQIALSQAANKIGDLLQLMDRVEPKNAYLFDTVAKVFCRVVSTEYFTEIFILKDTTYKRMSPFRIDQHVIKVILLGKRQWKWVV